VTDNGIGIPAENFKRLFEHGFTTKQEGHGFGLHSCALAVRELGGDIQTRSDGIGTGATFSLRLPLCPPALGQAAVADDHPQATPASLVAVDGCSGGVEA
jgi:signal transduction histidine kinase